MHILATTTASLDDLIEPVDLRQDPADMLVLSFTDSDLASLTSAWAALGDKLPSMRVASLRDLRHPMSVDLWIDSVAQHAKVILVRILGGYDWWRYGADRLAAIARERDIKLILLPGECREQDETLVRCSTLQRADLEAVLAYFREGGPDNMSELVKVLAGHAGHAMEAKPAQPLAKAGCYLPEEGIVAFDRLAASCLGLEPVALILFYRSMLLADDVKPIDELCRALHLQGIKAAPVFVSSLKDDVATRFTIKVAASVRPAVIICATAFAAGSGDDGVSLFDRINVPVLQVVVATTRREAWQSGQRGLAPADLAMHVVLPELDGRVLAGAISFKAEAADIDPAFGHRGQVNAPEADRIAQVARRVAKQVRLQQTPPAERRIVILLPDYPAALGRTGYAVGLDVPNSVLAMMHDLRKSGYHIEDIPENSRDLMQNIELGRPAISHVSYISNIDRMPAEAQRAVESAWGPFEAQRDGEQAFRFRAASFGNVTVAMAPDRGRSADRRADYHDPAVPPHHDLLAFGAWLRDELDCHAIVHVGAHGTLEWLPGKTVALTENCFPEIVTGAVPVIYPFIVSNPGEAAQAKRRIAAVTLSHLPPPLVEAGLENADHVRLERLVDEYAQADGLDRGRRDRLAKLIVQTATSSGLAKEAGIDVAGDPDTALMQIDAWLCDLKDFAIKDGLHVFGRADDDDPDAMRRTSATMERYALVAALDGRRIVPGPSGAPARNRSDVLPTGRNMFASDPRTMPTPTAFDLGTLAVEEMLRRYLQDHGDWPRSLVIDLWGSASLRTGGEEIAQGLALMGCRPQWDFATGRVTGIEVLPPAKLGRPRIDVTWRISGLFRDMFPTQIALMDAAVMAVSKRDEAEDVNPLAAERQKSGVSPTRIFGSSPGAYGSGVESLLADGNWTDRAELGRAYLDATSHAFGGADGEGTPVGDAFARRVADADLLVHSGDDPGRDMLEGSADVAFIGGFSAAVAAVGGHADLIALDTTNADKPKARSVSEAIARTVRARAINTRFIEGQLRHGHRGASEFAETVDRLIGFAETTNAIPGALIEAVYDAYVGNERVRSFMLRENPAAAQSIAERFAAARRRDLWRPLRNSIDNDLAALIAEAKSQRGQAA